MLTYVENIPKLLMHKPVLVWSTIKIRFPGMNSVFVMHLNLLELTEFTFVPHLDLEPRIQLTSLIEGTQNIFIFW